MSFSYQEELTSGVVSAVIGVVATYGVSLAMPTSDLTWALTAVGFASFFSGFFGSYYSSKE
ncbi:MAG: ABC-type antimicrobial peptide transport system permease subunit [Candidatus Nanohaloarchaea archaeon]|jgi:ABC-type antimicrobial peptide transport system permease subunit